ncbi:Fungal Zn2-Cys6 binuclear cluster domain-containing protein [Cladophialophora immunda]|nr:Fungal Zn2-Cys6 binuclear cluster domain-containing protein [Cladophialophora immunda]
MMTTNQPPTQHEFALIETRTAPRTLAHQSGARDARIKTACAECKRRKTKCDGTHPCYSCRWYKQPERCIYTFSRPALVLSRKNFESVRQRLETTTDILAKLFPSPSVDTLSGLSREELLQRIGFSFETISQETPNRGGLNINSLTPAEARSQDGRDDLIDPDDMITSGGLEPQQQDDAPSEGGDDVNALSATSIQPSSYVGPSSTMQMFRTILRIAPESVGQQQPTQSPATSQRSASYRSPEVSHKTPPSLQMTERIGALIDAYFYWIDPATPILDQAEFRKVASAGTRNDPPWLCLFNMVLALGSIGSTRTDSREHLSYYHAAKSHLDIEGLGNKNLETLQALILMAGWYNHYRNRPNLASALLGAAFRMAYALGLHKEQPSSNQSVENQELRRKIWWNLVVLDAAEAVTLGRTLDTKIFESEVKYPQEIAQDMSDTEEGPSPSSTLVITIGFSRIMTEIQSRLMTSNTVPFSELLSLDAHLVDWYEALPSYFHKLVGMGISTVSDLSDSRRFVQPCLTIRWRYLNLRMLLYRPSLMEAVLHRIPFGGLTSDQRLCVRKCLTLSGETIDSVKTRSSELPNQYIAWPSTWYLLQICMVPLLSLYVFRGDVNDQASQADPAHHLGFRHTGSVKDQVRQIRDECHRQVQTTLRLMKEMEPWAVASGKMHDLITHLYEARDQHLRVWNNNDESPMIVLGSPANSSMPSSDATNARALQADRANMSLSANLRTVNPLQAEDGSSVKRHKSSRQHDPV